MNLNKNNFSKIWRRLTDNICLDNDQQIWLRNHKSNASKFDSILTGSSHSWVLCSLQDQSWSDPQGWWELNPMELGCRTSLQLYFCWWWPEILVLQDTTRKSFETENFETIWKLWFFSQLFPGLVLSRENLTVLFVMNVKNAIKFVGEKRKWNLLNVAWSAHRWKVIPG